MIITMRGVAFNPCGRRLNTFEPLFEPLLKTTTTTTTTACTKSFSKWRKAMSAPQPLMPTSCHSVNPVVVSGLLAPQSTCVLISRGKTKKGKKNKSYYKKQDDDDSDFDDDDDDDEMELESGKDYKEIKAKLPSLRVDAILKAALNMPRNKVEAAFYASKIRVNEERLLKKSYQCHIGDEIDLIKTVSKDNPNTMYVSRVVLLAIGDIHEDEDRFTVKLRRYPNLLIESYKDFTPPEEEE